MAKKGKGNSRSGRRGKAHGEHTRHSQKNSLGNTKRSPGATRNSGLANKRRSPIGHAVNPDDAIYTDRPAGEIIINPPDDPHPTSGS